MEKSVFRVAKNDKSRRRLMSRSTSKKLKLISVTDGVSPEDRNILEYFFILYGNDISPYDMYEANLIINLPLDILEKELKNIQKRSAYDKVWSFNRPHF